ncbi:solute carrier family 22 member 13-like [Sitodiplosis mosellana]|uniref:solute carrier family 22 member 13-like n=1 Tax=Sitodiplosis mosellana TaxID=263140 RepID=UPI002443807A|nr:solute carrier family 22 member 13-like [Sitodiplosis mosellana]
MAPTPETFGPVVPIPNDNASNTGSPKNHYRNKAFVQDEVLDSTASPPVSAQVNGLMQQNRSNAENISDTLDFDDILPHIGEFGTYQKILFFLMIPFAFFVAFVYFSQIFITLVPEKHWCRIFELEHLPTEQRLLLGIPLDESSINGHSRCSMYAVNFTQILADGVTKADPNWPTVPCQNGWEFDKEELPYTTISTELEWVCDKAALPSFAQSIFFCGAIVGGLLFGVIADRYGRIPALVGTNMLGFIGGIATAYSFDFISFAFFRFIVGFAFDNCFTMMYILVLEYVGPKWRTFVANMSIAIFFTIAACMLPWIAIFLKNWQLLAIVTSVPLGLSLLTPWLVPESARWLVSQGKIKKAVKILRKFERINRTEVKPDIYDRFEKSCTRLHKEETANSNYSTIDLFRKPRLRQITMLLIVIWMAISLAFDGHVRNVGALGLDVFITFTIAAATEMPADVLLTFTLDIVGRRWYAFGSMVLSGIFSLLSTIFPIGIYSALMAIIGRFWINISYNIGLQYVAEVLPTVVRAQGVTFIHIMGYVSSIIAPFVVYLSYIHLTLPLIILGVIGIFGGILCLFLPETLDEELPQTLEDGEKFGMNQRFWDIPCFKRKVKDEPDTCGFERATSRISVGASLRASSRAEIGSNLLHRSVSIRRSTKATQCPPLEGLPSN